MCSVTLLVKYHSLKELCIQMLDIQYSAQHLKKTVLIKVLMVSLVQRQTLSQPEQILTEHFTH